MIQISCGDRVAQRLSCGSVVTYGSLQTTRLALKDRMRSACTTGSIGRRPDSALKDMPRCRSHRREVEPFLEAADGRQGQALVHEHRRVQRRKLLSFNAASCIVSLNSTARGEPGAACLGRG